MSGLLTSFFVVWRETFEALLIIFLVWTGFSRQGLWPRTRPYVFAGVLCGVICSALFAWSILFFSDSMEGTAASLMQAALPILAAVLMLHMVSWMASHAAEISGEIREMAQSHTTWTMTWGILLLVAYALTREGFETVVYLYGMSMNPLNAHLNWIHYAGILLAGTAASCASLFALNHGMRFFKIKTFFRVTNLFLLGTAASLLVNGINRLIEIEVLPPLIDPVWDTSPLVPGESYFGQALNLLLGYTPQPSLMLVIIYAMFWAIAAFLLRTKAGGHMRRTLVVSLMSILTMTASVGFAFSGGHERFFPGENCAFRQALFGKWAFNRMFTAAEGCLVQVTPIDKSTMIYREYVANEAGIFRVFNSTPGPYETATAQRSFLFLPRLSAPDFEVKTDRVTLTLASGSTIDFSSNGRIAQGYGNGLSVAESAVIGLEPGGGVEIQTFAGYYFDLGWKIGDMSYRDPAGRSQAFAPNGRRCSFANNELFYYPGGSGRDPLYLPVFLFDDVKAQELIDQTCSRDKPAVQRRVRNGH